MTVLRVVETTCDTGLLGGLTGQIFARMNRIQKDISVRVSHVRLRAASRVNLFLQRPARDALLAALDSAPAALGTLDVESMQRGCDQQFAVNHWKAKGRCGVPKAAPVGGSRHEEALAIDIGQANRHGWIAHLEKHGWVWFGPSDAAHLTYHGAGVVHGAGKVGVMAFQQLFNEHNPGSPLVVDGVAGSKTLQAIGSAPAGGW